MSGLQALQAFQQGTAWRQNQEQLGIERQQQQQMLDANKAFGDTVKQAQADHEAQQAAALADWQKQNGTDEGFKAQPFNASDNRVMFSAAKARGDALLKAGNFDAYAQERAKLIPMQMAARREAWDQFQQDGDHGALVKRMYDAIPDGVHIQSYDTVDGPGPDGKKAAPKIRLQLSDGTTKMMAPADIEGRAKQLMQDPALTAKMDYERDLWDAKQKITTAGQKEVATHRHGLTMEEIGARGATATDVANIRADASTENAKTRAAATTTAAATRAAGGGRGLGSAGNPSSMDLRVLQQQRLRVDQRRKEVNGTLAAIQKRIGTPVTPDEKAEMASAVANHKAAMAKLDAEDQDIANGLKQMSSRQGGGLSSVGKPAATAPKSGDYSGLWN